MGGGGREVQEIFWYNPDIRNKKVKFQVTYLFTTETIDNKKLAIIIKF